MFICICHAVSEKNILEEINKGACCSQEIGCRLQAGTSCGRCLESIDNIILKNKCNIKENNNKNKRSPIANKVITTNN